MSLNHAQGPVPSELYMGFSTKPLEVRGARNVRRRRNGGSALMAAGVAVAALTGVALGLRDTRAVTYAESLRTDAYPALSPPVEPSLAEPQTPAIPWQAASIETTSALTTGAVEPLSSAASPTPVTETPSDERRRRRLAATGPGSPKAEVKKERRAEVSKRVSPTRKASNSSRTRIRPPGWPYASSAVEPPH